MNEWLKRQWFLLALTCVVTLAFLLTDPLSPLLEWEQLRLWVVAAVLFLMSLPLHLSAFTQVVLRPQPALLACVINLGLGPLCTWPLIGWLGPELGGGLAVALSTPCTLASAAVWTRRSGGNDVTALMVTVVTNLLCVVLTPLWIQFLTARADEAGIGLGQQVWKLTMLVLVPIVAAQSVRILPGVGKWAGQQKSRLSILAQVGLLYIVLLGTIGSAIRWRTGEAASAAQWAILLSAIFGIHLFLFAVGLGTSGILGMDSRERRAVAISGSQKTLMVGAEMGLSLGLSVLPLLIYHLFQLFADTFLADGMKRYFDSPADSLTQAGDA